MTTIKSLAILPHFNSYTELKVSADIYAVRSKSQLFALKQDRYNFVIFDEYIEQDIAQKYNKISVYEAMCHAIKNGMDCTIYKGLSLVDINFIEFNHKVFLPAYREALGLISLLNHYRPNKIIVSSQDTFIDLFEDLARQFEIHFEVVETFGLFNESETALIEDLYAPVFRFDWHSQKGTPLMKSLYMTFINLFSVLIRSILKKKRYAALLLYHPLYPIRERLFRQKSFHPLVFSPVKMSISEILTSGIKSLEFKDVTCENPELEQVLRKYDSRLDELEKNYALGNIDMEGKDVSIAKYLIMYLRRLAPRAFRQIVANIDFIEEFISQNNVSALLTAGDTPWNWRLPVMIFKKSKIPTLVITNGWLGDDFQQEAKTADIIFCYGDEAKKSYYKNKENVFVTGNPLFDAAFEKRKIVTPSFPIKRILIGTYVFSGGVDINSHYSDHETYMEHVLFVLKELQNKLRTTYQLTIKIHPSDSLEYYRWFIGKLDYTDLDIIKKGKFQHIAKDYDLAIMSYSTALFETALMGIPVVFYHPSKQILFAPFNGYDKLPSAFSIEELEAVLTQVMTNREYAYLFTQVDNLKPFTGQMDGKAGERIISKLNSLIDNINKGVNYKE
ncbi:CDP-glycerol glycerophosphotransferase domain protein [Candidatus Magnetoovum chiemensis]|nr:CDP-glycerol glycerophosphotransferase domain protein [Candidatus Magnetoovum chiemensis]